MVGRSGNRELEDYELDPSFIEEDQDYIFAIHPQDPMFYDEMFKSIHMDFSLITSDDSFDGLAHHILEETGLIRKRFETLKCILLNLYLAWLKDKTVSVHLKKEVYTDIRFYHPNASYDTVVDVKKALDEKNFIRVHRGSNKYGRITSIAPKVKLIELFDDLPSCRIDRTEPERLIEIRKSRVRPIKYAYTSRILSMEKKLRNYNDFISAQDLKLRIDLEGWKNQEELISTIQHSLQSSIISHPHIPHPSLSLVRELLFDKTKPIGDLQLNSNRLKLVRIFNSDLNHGGRFYRSFVQGWQKLKRPDGRKLRNFIQINGEPTIELDYDAIHLNLLYNRIAEEMPEDNYSVESFERDDAKLATFIMVNAEEERKAVFAIKEELGFDDLKMAWKLIDEIKRKHTHLSGFWCSGEGLRLMRDDSDICNRILLSFVRQSKPVLPIHDSFIVVAFHNNPADFS